MYHSTSYLIKDVITIRIDRVSLMLLYYVIPIRVLDYYIRVSSAPIWQFNLSHNNNNKNFMLCKTHWLVYPLSGLATILYAQSFFGTFYLCAQQAWGSTPTAQIVQGVLIWSGPHKYTHNHDLSFEKNFKKKFGWYMKYVIPLGWWLGEVIFYASI